MKCNQCDSMYINGLFCHETGCPNKDKVYVDGEWVNVNKVLLDSMNDQIDAFVDGDGDY